MFSENEFTWCVAKHGVSVMAKDTQKPTKYGYKWVYIPERKWLRMSEKQKKRYLP